MPSPNILSGVITAVPCAHCGFKNDCRDIQGQNLLEKGADMECDHCQQLSQIVNVVPTTVVTVRQKP